MKNNILLQAELKKNLERAKTSPLQSIFLRISGPAAEQRGARPLPIDENPIRTHFPWNQLHPHYWLSISRVYTNSDACSIHGLKMAFTELKMPVV